MIKARLFAFSGILSTLALFAACGDGEKNTADSGLGGNGNCPGATECGGVCVNTKIDSEHCGACDASCAEGEACSAGKCEPTSCSTGLTECTSGCANLKIDSSNCGACDKKCAGSEVCNAGKCEAADCPTGQVACDGTCVTLAADQNNCGACGTVCDPGELCGTGVCAPSCGTGLIACDNSCVNPSSDPKYCGATDCSAGAGGAAQGVECGAKEACVIGECRMFTPTWAPGEDVGIGNETTRMVGEEQSIGMDSDGNAIILFRQQTTAGDDSSYRAFVIHYDAATKAFGTPVALHTAGTAPVRNLKIAVGPTGDALAVWVSGAIGDSQLMFASLSGQTNVWTAAARLDVVDTTVDTPDVAIEPDGDAVVVWSQKPFGGAQYDYGINVRRRTGGAFQSVESLPRQASGLAVRPRVAVNDAGAMAIAYTEQDAASAFVPLVSRYSSGWTTPHDLRTAASQTGQHWGEFFDLGIDSSGNITVVFSDDEYNTDVSIYESVFSSALGTWSTATQVESLSGAALQASHPNLSVEADGSAFLVFQIASYYSGSDVLRDGTLDNFTDVYGAVRASNGTWGGEMVLGALGASSSLSFIDVRSDDNGNAFAFWVQGASLKARRYVGDDADWGATATLSESGLLQVVSPDVTVGPNGNAIASWIQNKPSSPSYLYIGRFD